ncbi:MAG: hypothetical protein HOV71_19085 [Hamadaea sp.]|nr:hypothetical protein [Hamadaea sp.]
MSTWAAGESRGFFWGDLAESAPPSSWTSVAEQRLAAGLELGRDNAVLHTDGLGLQDLYVRRHGGAVYFSVRIDPLLDIVDGGLRTDWTAWSSIAGVTAPLADTTPFLEIRRMQAATAWRAEPHRVEALTFEPGWLGCEPNGKVTPADAADIVASHVEGARRQAAITLSGGWDSRLLAILARRRRRLIAWTTSNDDGRDRDIDYAQRVARALRMKHRVFLPGADAWLDEHSAVRQRLNYQTTHHVWIMPLVRALHERQEEFLDGLAGDVLFKSLFVSQEVANAPSAEHQRRLLWNSLEQKRLQQRGLLAPGVAAAFEDRSRASLDDAVSRFAGHPAASTLGVLHTRTARAIGSSAQWLLAPEVNVRLPFVHPTVIAAALRVPLTAKIGGGFYRDMLHAANPAVAALPSTNDPVKPTGTRAQRRQANLPALTAMAQAIRGDQATLMLLAPDMRQALKDPDALALIGRSSAGLRTLQWASLLGEWRTRYASRLIDSGFDQG